MAGVIEELNNILEELDKGTASSFQVARYQGTVKKILDRDPKNVFALYLKVKLLILSTRPKDRIRIKTEVLNLVNIMANLAHSASYYHRKWALLNDLNLQDVDVFQEQTYACQEILKTPRNPSSEIYHTIATKFLGGPGTTKTDPVVSTQGPISQNRPGADFTVDKSSGEPPLSVQFVDRSSGDPHTWNWEFGDGDTSREASPGHIYDAEGQYTVSLTVTNKSGSDMINKNGLILVAVRSTDRPDSDGIYGKAITGMVKDYPEFIDLVLAGPHKKVQLKGYVLDAFGGETPKEFHALMNCVDEEIPLIILENMNDKIKQNAKVETRKVSLKNRGLSPEFVDWAVEIWKLSFIHENMNNTKNSTIPAKDDSEIIF